LKVWLVSMNTVIVFNKAISWIDAHTIPNSGIAVNSKNLLPYPEVTGYYIPTLLDWRETDKAIAYGRWLLSRQHNEGCWGDANANDPYAFDTGQIIKGLLALAKHTKTAEWDSAIERACDWMCECITQSGEPVVPDVKGWGGAIPLGILLYAFQAVREAGEFYGNIRWVKTMDKSISWFLNQQDLTKFTHLSHFHAYILEALCDLGFYDMAREGMKQIEKLQREDGSVPAFPNVRWVCSTGLFQYAIVWYKLGDRVRADKAFAYAASLQNKSGGWYGSYGWFSKYFPKAEIAWAVKYFLDALKLRLKSGFESQSVIFSDHIDSSDGRYLLVKDMVKSNNPSKILDAGCGKGRYLRNLLVDFPDKDYFAIDLSQKVMSSIPRSIKTSQGSLLSIPHDDNSFDFIYTVEALEHAVNIDGALLELKRALKPDGTLLIIDKNIKSLGRFKLPDWEQWFDTLDLRSRLEAIGFDVEVIEGVPYEGQSDQLFTAWIAKKTRGY
jgi:malonyl-CoA O-methyltransferase